MTATAALTADLQRQVLALEDDMRDRLAADPDREGSWKQEHQSAVEKERTGSAWVTWRDDRITQAAVAWVLTTVFIRFCEDNSLLRPVWITGPGSRRQEAVDAQMAFFREHPEETDREWLLDAVGYLGKLPATRSLVESHSALHLIGPSGGAAGRLLEFWRRRGDDGALVHDLADPSLSTRFLGDLYQDLSQYARDTFALLQTPVFVEEFILDQAMEPALAERPLEGFKMIDPTCGSGHFLLGAFDRLLDRWHRHAPDMDTQARVQMALDAIHGVDLNPFAIAIARFRLTLGALGASGLTSLEQAPAFSFHLAAGDSLIHGPDPEVMPGMELAAFMPFTYATEDRDLLLTLLEEGRYDVVVGNPPYITVKDKALNRIYRQKYADVCQGKYALTVPFMKLIFSLAKSGPVPGWTGQITSNSFMKREFGSKIIENFLAHKDLRLVVDASGAYIPGHGTPTVILAGRRQAPAGLTVRAVLGVRGEPGRPAEPSKGAVWTSIAEHVNQPGWNDAWVTVTDLDRRALSSHPWSLAGGGAVELLNAIDKAMVRHVSEKVTRIGFFGVMGSDEAMSLPPAIIRRHGLEPDWFIPVVVGDGARDYTVTNNDVAWFPYTVNHDLRPIDSNASSVRWLWPLRTELGNRATFSGGTYFSDRRPWYEWHQLPKVRLDSATSIVFAAVSTHNHFIIECGGRAFKQSAPLLKFADRTAESDYMGLLGILNSSIACFWLKRQCQEKPSNGVKRGYESEAWTVRYDFSGTAIQNFPLPRLLPVALASELDALANAEIASSPPAAVVSQVRIMDALEQAAVASRQIRRRMIAVQEELDWQAYGLYELVEEDLTYVGDDLPLVALGERAFEIVLARAVTAGVEETAWFTRHGSLPVTEIPTHWPADYRALVQRRLQVIASNPFIALLERPEYKRRWAQESWEKRQERALREWLLDRLEDRKYWFDPQGRPRPRSVGQLADEVSRDVDITSVLALWEGRPDVPMTQSLVRLLADEAVPFLAACRYKDTGLRKRQAWEQTWLLQRREDAGEKVGPIPVPPKYTSADFLKSSYWAARGKLDVPKERFIAYPDAGRETDPTPLLGWAGWDHSQQALALALVVSERERDGWADDRLVPLVAGMAEMQPWVDQWHAEIDPAYGVSPAAFCREQLTARAAQVGKTLDELAAWRPAAARRGRGRADPSKPAASEATVV